MAAIIVNQGLDRLGINASQTSGFATGRHIRTMSVDDDTAAFTATDQGLDDAGGGAPANEFDAALDGTPADPSAQAVSHVMTIPTGSGNFTIRRVALHDDTAANVTTTSHTLFGGVDGQTFAKTSDFTMALTLTITYSDAS